MERLPSKRFGIVTDALPFTTGAEPRSVGNPVPATDQNRTVPDGVPTPLIGVTEAVIVTDWPETVSGMFDDTTVAV
jgi:hypothetical protein